MSHKWIPLGILAVLAVLSLGVSTQPPVVAGEKIDFGDTAWLLTATGLVLLMTPGLSFFYAGMVSTKNVISTMLQSFIFAMFQLKFAVITPSLITGSFAERVRFSAYLVFMCLFCIFIYSPLAHWTWHPQGFLRQWGVLDFAGGTVVHMSAGFAALAGAIVLGRRRSHEDGGRHVASNVPYVLLGTGMLWFGWFGFNAGSALAANETAAMAFATTMVASASAMMTWI